MAEADAQHERASRRESVHPAGAAPTAAETPVALNPLLAHQQTVGNQAVQRQLRTGTLPPGVILGQQRTLGNQAVQRLLRTHRLQAKLSVTAPDDQDEQAADRVAASAGGTRVGREARRAPSPAQEAGLRTQAGTVVVQRITEGELKDRGAKIREMAESAPEKGVNLWMARHNGSSVHLLGTEHARNLSEVGTDASMRDYLIKFLTSGQFTSVYTEKVEDIPYIKHDANLAGQLERFIEVKTAVENDLTADPESSRYKRAAMKLANARTGGLNDVLRLSLDAAYLSLATSGKEVERLGLETDETRLEAKKINMRDMNIEENDPTNKLYKPDGASGATDDSFRKGDQKRLFNEVANEIEEGRDLASGEERNRQWMDILQKTIAEAPQIKHLWIVGAAHLPGLIVRFKELKWAVEHQEPPTL